jgi:hypothetical protein
MYLFLSDFIILNFFRNVTTQVFKMWILLYNCVFQVNWIYNSASHNFLYFCDKVLDI